MHGDLYSKLGLPSGGIDRMRTVIPSRSEERDSVLGCLNAYPNSARMPKTARGEVTVPGAGNEMIPCYA